MAIGVILGAFSAVSHIAGGQQAKRQGYANAESIRNATAYNSAVTEMASEYSASAIEQTAIFNVMAGTILATRESEAITMVANYNGQLRLQTAEHNATLLVEEAELAWVAAGLDEMLFEQQAQKTLGAIQTGYAKNGLMLDTGTTLNTLIDARTQFNLEKHIIRFNADIKAKKLLDKAAVSMWEGRAEANAIVYEGIIASEMTEFRQGVTNVINIGQSTFDAAMTRFQGRLEADGIRWEGEWLAMQAESGADAAFVTGLFNAGSSAMKSYANYSRMNPPAAQPSVSGDDDSPELDS